MAVTPSTTAVKAVLAALAARGAPAAVGGSGLLAALGLVDRVRDWDVTTDADARLVRAALDDTGLPYRSAAVRDGLYATRERYVVAAADHEVDVIVGFAVRVPTPAADETELVSFPTRVSGHWHDLPVADPAVWARAYRLIGRPARAELLERWLAQST